MKVHSSRVTWLGSCGLLLACAASACSDDDTPATPHGGGQSSTAGADGNAGESAGNAAGATSDTRAGAGSGGGDSTAGGGEGSGGAGSTAGATNGGGAETDPDGDGGAAGDGSGGPLEPVIKRAEGWTDHEGVVNSMKGSIFDHALAFDLRGNGDAVAVWSQVNGATTDIFASRYVGGAWLAAQVIDGAAGDAAQPHVTMDGQGNAMAIWQQREGQGRFRIYSASYVAELAMWTSATPHEIGPAPFNATNPRVAADLAGNVLATWNSEYGSEGVVTGVRVLTSLYQGAADTPTWTTPATVSSTGSPQRCGRPRVALSSAGHGFVAWSDAEGANEDRRVVLAAKYSVSAAAAAGPKLLNQLEPGEEPAQIEDSPQVVVNADGDAIATWRQVGVSGGEGVGLSWFHAATNGWGAQANLCEGLPKVGEPALGLNDNGKFAVSYWQTLPDHYELMVAQGRMEGGGFDWAGANVLFASSASGAAPSLAVDESGYATLAWAQPVKGRFNMLVGRVPRGAGPRYYGTVQRDPSYHGALPQLGVSTGTDNVLLTYIEGDDLRSTSFTPAP